MGEIVKRANINKNLKKSKAISSFPPVDADVLLPRCLHACLALRGYDETVCSFLWYNYTGETYLRGVVRKKSLARIPRLVVV